MLDFQSLAFEYWLFLVFGSGLFIKALFVFRHLCKRGLHSEQMITVGIMMVGLLQAASAGNHLINPSTILQTSPFFKIFFLAGGCFSSLVNLSILETFNKYRGVRRTRPKTR